ncbi:transmembrane amino acid transporter protein-domain-containing protein [Fusarium redolens]|uniref:Transmembrane amino acid transporter protein-domain-containing protein n=1 Tax=Fusarium redolens TaxID=48865 RepID=A0A9P9HND2_FUSRE|nr:transmembrane amino acid transporter protein-domain-containing protein [Fusarium redolens]KAH7260705.1 transmembrane amino acid transporter protein-domain-containing protein [Fusarium redolens]
MTSQDLGSFNADPITKDPVKTVNPQTSNMDEGVLRGEVFDLNKREDIERQKTREGETHFSRLGWKRMTVILIVEAIALGVLSLPKAFASLGMVLGVVLCIGVGLIALYGSVLMAQVQLRNPHVSHYVDLGTLMFGSFGTKLTSVFVVGLLTMVVGSHCLTGAIALSTITQSSSVCSIIFGLVSAFIMLLLSLPPSFAEIAILGYIDFASIMLAIGITVIGTGVQRSDSLGSYVPWSAWPKEDLTISEAIVAINNIVFAYGFAVAQPSFMSEMHTPADVFKSTQALAAIEIILYTLTGALIYVFVGQEVQSPALLSVGTMLSRVAFGVALPVILISGSINTTIVCRYIHGRYYRDSVVRFINTKKGWISWIILVCAVTAIAWIVAEAIPFFSELLSICATLFISGLSFYLPALMWFILLKDGPWTSKRNIIHTLGSGLLFLFGVAIFGFGMYSSIEGLITKFESGSINRPFTCSRT